MALGQTGKLNNQLLDTLIQLNDVIKALNGKEYSEKVSELKEKTDAYNASKSSTEPLIIALNEATAKNEESIEAAKKEHAALSHAKLEIDRQTQKLNKAQNDLEFAKRDHERKVGEAEKEIAAKLGSASAREKKADEKAKQADALIAEYQNKLADLKKITG